MVNGVGLLDYQLILQIKREFQYVAIIDAFYQSILNFQKEND